MNMKEAVKSYGSETADKYDEYSMLNKGDRNFHCNYLAKVLQYTCPGAATFLDLGCGTGFFTEIFYNVFPDIRGIAIDGSSEMLKFARERFAARPVDISFIQSLFTEIDWGELRSSDIVFSSLALHHLTDEEKWRVLKNIHTHITPGGVFVTYDVFRSGDERTDLMMEHLACSDMRSRIIKQLGITMEIDELSIERIIENDRKIKAEEGDHESIINEYLEQLEASGFHHICTFLQENRFYGITAFK